MGWKDLICLCVTVLGIIAFLYGSSSYNAVFGWVGVFLMVVGVVAEVGLEVYGALRKRGS